MIPRRCFAIALLVFPLLSPNAKATESLQSPDDVKYALQLLMHITNDFDRQITRKTYARLPHENEEFIEGADALRKAIASEPEDFKQEVESALGAALSAAKDTADKNATNDEIVLRAAQGVFVEKVNVLLAVFPESLRPDPKFMFKR
ncbi:MAG: hypothetical protein KDE14_12720 [Rhodobacteraceae bacterium]|nr:hypothetical protein [Paracoccaceae bacterium]